MGDGQTEPGRYGPGQGNNGLSPYDGFRQEDQASVRIESIKVFQGVEKTKRYSFWDIVRFILWVALGLAVVGIIVAASVLMAKNSKSSSSEDKAPASSDTPSVVIEGETPGTAGAPPAPPGVAIDEEGQMVPASDEDGTLEIMTDPSFAVPDGWTALWWDEFDGDRLNTRWWSYQYGYGQEELLWAWGNGEEQYYTDRRENIKVSDGTLKITARREDVTLDDGYVFEYTSGRITTRGKAGFFGGMSTADGKKWDTIRIEASLKAPIQSMY